VEIFEPDLVASPLSPTEIRRRCADSGLSIDLYQPFRDLDSIDADRFAANLRRAEPKFAVLQQLGTDTVLVCSAVAPDAVADLDLLAAQMHALAERAARHGLRIPYEALAWGTRINTYEQSWEVVRRGDHPALGLCLDSFHILSRGSDPAGILGIPGEKLFFLQLADAPRLRMDVLQWSRHHRLFPGQGGMPCALSGSPVPGGTARSPWTCGNRAPHGSCSMPVRPTPERGTSQSPRSPSNRPIRPCRLHMPPRCAPRSCRATAARRRPISPPLLRRTARLCSSAGPTPPVAGSPTSTAPPQPTAA